MNTGFVCREFNQFEVKDSSVIKKSKYNHQFIRNEINWYLTRPDWAKQVTPELLTYDSGQNPFYEMSLITGPNVYEWILDHNRDTNLLPKIVDGVQSFIINSCKYSEAPRKQHLIQMYVFKTLKRIADFYENPGFKDMMGPGPWGTHGLEHFTANVVKNQYKYANTGTWSCIHGDMHFSNMVFDTIGDRLMFVDPRGMFGKQGCYGDIMYDLAKLMGSIVYKTDFIARNNFMWQNGMPQINSQFDDLSESLSDIFLDFVEYGDHIRFVCASQMIGSIPLHANNNVKRAFLAQGLLAYNDLLSV